MDWDTIFQALERNAERAEKERLLALLHQEAAEGRAGDEAFRERLNRAFSAAREPWLAAAIKRLQNRLRGRAVLGRDLLRMTAPPVGDEEQKRLWEDLHRLKSAHDRVQAEPEPFEARYDVREQIGEGGMSTVFRAVRDSDGTEVAVKLLREAFFDQPSMLERFRRECRLSLSFDHPRVVRVLEAGDDGRTGFIVMEHLPLGGLDARLPDPGLTPRVALAATRQAAEALAYLHAKAVVHRDVKLGNLLVARWEPEDGREPLEVKLTDFGLSKALPGDGLTRVGTRMGSEFYAAPEQLSGAGTVDARADIYSLGVVLYRLISKKGFPEGRYPPLTELCPELPARVDRLLERCLEPDPQRRSIKAVDVVEELQGVENALAVA